LLRTRTQTGSELNVSLFDVAAEWMSVPFLHASSGDGAPSRAGLRHPSIAPYGAFEDKEGTLTLLSISNVLRVKNRDTLEAAINNATRKLGTAEFRRALNDASIAYGAVNTVDALLDHPALRTRTVINSREQIVTMPAHPYLSDGSAAGREIPRLDQHGVALRQEFA